MIGKSMASLDVEVYVAAIAEWSGEFVWMFVLLAGACGRDQVIVPMVGDHREEQVEAGIGEEPGINGQRITDSGQRRLFKLSVFRFPLSVGDRSLFDVA